MNNMNCVPTPVKMNNMNCVPTAVERKTISGAISVTIDTLFSLRETLTVILSQLYGESPVYDQYENSTSTRCFESDADIIRTLSQECSRFAELVRERL